MSNGDLQDIKTEYSHCKRLYSGKLAPSAIKRLKTSLKQKIPKPLNFGCNRFAIRLNQKQGLRKMSLVVGVAKIATLHP